VLGARGVGTHVAFRRGRVAGCRAHFRRHCRLHPLNEGPQLTLGIWILFRPVRSSICSPLARAVRISPTPVPSLSASYSRISFSHCSTSWVCSGSRGPISWTYSRSVIFRPPVDAASTTIRPASVASMSRISPHVSISSGLPTDERLSHRPWGKDTTCLSQLWRVC